MKCAWWAGVPWTPPEALGYRLLMCVQAKFTRLRGFNMKELAAMLAVYKRDGYVQV